MVFEIVEPSTATIDPAVAQQPVQDLMQLLDGDPVVQNNLLPDPSGDPPVVEPVVAEPTQLAPSPEQPLVEDSEQLPAETTYTLKVNGEDRQVTLNNLKEGFQRQSDYTRKMQEMVEERGQLGLRSQEVERQREQYSQLLGFMGQKLETLIPKEPDWTALANQDPIEHSRKRAAWDQMQDQMKAVQSEQQRLEQERRNTFQQGHQNYVQQQQAALLKARPEFSDNAKFQEFYSGVNQYATHNYGFTPQEISQISDARHLLILDKAMKYDALTATAKGKQVGDPNNPTPHIPTLQPGSRQVAEPGKGKDFRKANERLERSGSVDDAAAAILARL